MMPLFFASSALYPLAIMPAWLRVVAHAQPAHATRSTGCESLLLGVARRWDGLGRLPLRRGVRRLRGGRRRQDVSARDSLELTRRATHIRMVHAPCFGVASAPSRRPRCWRRPWVPPWDRAPRLRRRHAAAVRRPHADASGLSRYDDGRHYDRDDGDARDDHGDREPPRPFRNPTSPPRRLTTSTALARAETTARRPTPRERRPRRAPPPAKRPLGAGAPTDYGTPALSGGPYVFPVLANASFGDSWGAVRSDVGWHHGVDIFAPRGAPVAAVADGVLLSVGWNGIGGRRLWLRDRAGNFFYYAHLSRFAAIAADGARVRAGTVIGFVGNTGDAAGRRTHLHFEIHPASLLSVGYDGAVDPFPYVSAWQRLTWPRPLRGSRRAPGPAPAAILVGYVDISSAAGLSRATAERALQQPIVADASAALPLRVAPAAARHAAACRRRPHGAGARRRGRVVRPRAVERLGRAVVLRVRRELEREHRQRLRRRPAVPASDVERARRRRVRAVRRTVRRATSRSPSPNVCSRRRAGARGPPVARGSASALLRYRTTRCRSPTS